MPKYKIFSMDHLLLPSPNLLFNKNLKEMDSSLSLTNNSQTEREIPKLFHTTRELTRGAVLGDGNGFWSFDDHSVFEVHHIKLKI